MKKDEKKTNKGKIEIPEQLRNDSFRFVKIKVGTKRPSGTKWNQEQNGANYSYDDPGLTAWLHQGKSYGVTAFGNLLIIDADREAVVTEIRKYLPSTFSVRSGGAPYKRHFYYICPDADPNNCELQIDGKNAGHLTMLDSNGKSNRQNIGPNSIHNETGRRYEIVQDLPICEIAYEQISEVLSKFFKKSKPKKSKADNGEGPVKKVNKDRQTSADTKFDVIKQKIDLTEVLECDYDEIICCPLVEHDDTHPSFHVSKDGQHFKCFGDGCRASKGGDIIDYFQLKGKCNAHEAARQINRVFKLGIDFSQYVRPSWAKNGGMTEHNILDKFMQAIRMPRNNGSRLLGEYENSLLTLFTFTSILTRCPLNLAVLGRSGEGKTEITQAVSTILPESWTHIGKYSLTGSFTPKALKYLGQPIMKTVKDKDGKEKEVIDYFEVNLDGKIIMLLDDSGDQAGFIEACKPLLSRDTETITNYVSPAGNSRHADSHILTGWPCITVLSSSTDREAEQMGRFLTISPSPPKKMTIMSDILIRDAIPTIIDNSLIDECKRYLGTLKKVSVKIPFDLQPIVTKISSEQGVRHLKSMQTIIKSIAAFFQPLRAHLPGDESVIFANRGDIELGFRLLFPSMQSSYHNVAPGVLDCIKDVKSEFGTKPFYCTEVMKHITKLYGISDGTFYTSYWNSMKPCSLLRALSDEEIRNHNLDNKFNKRWYVIEQTTKELETKNLNLDIIKEIELYPDIVESYFDQYHQSVNIEDLTKMFQGMHENYYDSVKSVVVSDYENRWTRLESSYIDDDIEDEDEVVDAEVDKKRKEVKDNFMTNVLNFSSRKKDVK